MFLFLIFLYAGHIDADDWRAIRGNDGTGVVSPGEVLSTGQAVELKVAWKKKIGSGYSSVVVSDDRVIVLFTQDELDVIACLNASNGTTIWKKSIGAKFVGKNGSFDGPLATPFVDGHQVFVINALGKIICFQLDDGTEAWSRELQKQDEAPLPLYGFTTSPVVYQDNLIVQTGAKGNSLAAFNKNTGEPVWSCTDDRIDSQTPTLTKIGNQAVLLAAGGEKLTGVNPEDGSILFEYAHDGGNGSAMMPVLFDENKVLLTLDDRFSKAVSLRPVDDTINVSEEWQQPTIKNTYNVPAIHNGHAYAFSTRILTSVDTATGKANWKSRKPGDGFLIVVDGHMIVSTKKGGLYIAKATPDKYETLAQLQLFEDLVWSIPAYSENSIYQRSLGEVARVDIVSAADSVVANDVQSLPVGKQFSEFVDLVTNAAGEDQAKLIDDYLRTTPVPVVEGNIVHFVYRGAVSDVAVASDIFGARQERKMKRVGDSDLFYYAVELPADQRANYVFVVDYKMTADANNMQRLTTSTVYAGEMEFAVRLRGEEPLNMNWFAMNEWNEPPFIKAASQGPPKLIDVEIVTADDQPESDAGEGEAARDESVKSESSPKQRPPTSYKVLLPPNYENDVDKRYHVVYVLAGSAALKFGSLAAIVNDIFRNQGKPGYDKVEPCIVVFTDNAGPELTEKIVPSVDSKFRTIASRDGRSVIGNSFLASASFSAGLKTSGIFSGVATQSPLMFAAAKESLTAQLQELDQPVRVYMDWGNFDLFNPDENWDVRKDGQEVFEMLGENDNVQLAGGQVHDSTDWFSWRNRLDKVLKHITGSK